MLKCQTRGQRWWLLGMIATALVVCVAALLPRSIIENAVRARIESAALRHGAVVRIGVVHVGLWPLLRLEGFDFDLRSGVQLHTDMIEVTWPGRVPLAVRAATLQGPAGIGVSSATTVWDLAGIFGEDVRLTLLEPQAGLSIRKLSYPMGSAWNIEARGLDAGRLLEVQRDARALFDGGIADGRVDFQADTEGLRFHVGMSVRGVRLGALADSAADEPQLGDLTDVTLRFDGAWRRILDTIEIPEFHATVAGAALSGSITLRDLNTDPAVDLALGM